MTSEAGLRAWLAAAAGTVRFRITVIATVVVAVMLTATALGLIKAQRLALIASLDATLRQRADAVAQLMEAGELRGPIGNDATDESIVQIATIDGEVVAESRAIAGEPSMLPPAELAAGDTVRTMTLVIDDDPFRVLARPFTDAAPPMIIMVAASTDDVGEATRILTGSLTVTIPIVAALLAALTWILVGRTLRPVEVIRAVADDITGTDLRGRVTDVHGDDEIVRLAHTINAMLDRVEHATTRQQRFVADASHELRSPLARIRSELEVDLAHPDRSDLLRTHRSVLDETIGLHHLVDDLLYLARADGGHTIASDEVDLDDIVLDAAAQIRNGAGIAVKVGGVSAAQVRGDAAQLRRAIANLAENAARHAERTVTFEIVDRDTGATISVADDGAGIPADRRADVFERFTRLDDARHHAAGGAGLGLSITRDIIERHGGTIMIDPDHHPGARFVITIPRR